VSTESQPQRRALPRVQLRARLPIAVPGLVVAAVFAVATAITMVIALQFGMKPFYYDAGGYWVLADQFVNPSGHFSLLSFNSDVRGYSLPLIYHLWTWDITNHWAWNGSRSAKLLNALIFAGVATVLVPAFARTMFPEQRWGILRRAGMLALILVFWGGYLAFPLSDFPALAMALLALIAVARAPSVAWSAVAGFAVGFAVNMRPAYIMLAPILLVLMLWSWRDVRRAAPTSTGRWLLCLLVLAWGFFMVSYPQSVTTHRNYGKWSFIPGAPLDLKNYQLTSGMQVQRYETLVAPGKMGGLVYDDGPGLRLLAKQPDAKIKGTGQYLGLVITHPITMGGLALRHAFNGFDQRYWTPYPEKLDDGSHLPLRLFGFLLLFLALLRLAWPQARRRLGAARWRYVAALPLSCVTSLASAMETRFMLPLFVLSWILVLGGGWPNPIGGKELGGLRRLRTPAIIAASYLVFMLITWSIVSGATDHLHVHVSGT
jgi:hypothetical protein